MNNFYGFLTKKGKNIFLITLLSTALLFASCINDLFENDKSSKKQQTQTEQTEQTGSEELIPVKINISNKKQIENILQNVKPQKNISQARAASPQNVTLAYKILYKKVTDASSSVTVNQDNKEYESELTDSSPVLQLSKGNWDFTLIAYFNEKVVFTGDLLNQPIDSGNNTLNFTLEEMAGKGSIKITLVIPKSADYTTTVQAQLKKYPSQDVIDTKTDLTLQDQGDDSDKASCVYSIGDVENGMYFAVFSITTKNLNAAAENSTETTVYPVPVRVVINLTSESVETLSEIRNVCVITYDLGTDSSVSWTAGTTLSRVYKKHQKVTLPTYESLAPIKTKIFNGWKDQDGNEVTSPMIITQNVTLEPDWITTTLYVDGSATEAEHDALTTGTAVKTLQDAVNKLVTYEALDDGDNTSYQHEWTINVNGTCYGTSDLSSQGITKLTITGDNYTQDILDGRTSATETATDSVITNKGTYPLFIENLTIQNGNNNSGGGGGLNITKSTVYLNNVLLKGNTANDNGGGLFISNSTAYLNGVVLIDNTASENGGAIALTNSKLFIYGGCHIGPDVATDVATDTACSNKAGGNGGGIYADENSTIYFGYTDADETDETNVTLTAETGIAYNNITYNYAGAEGNGGGIYCLGKLYINGGTISYNSAANGGGISVSNETHLTGTTICNNEATSKGGGIYDSGTLEISAATIKSNKANFSGGGIYTTNLSMKGSTVSNNAATVEGGGIFINSLSTTKSSITSAGPTSYTEISGNTSSSSGGGIALYGGELYISDTIISGNEATSKGGGIYVNKWSSDQDAKLFLYGTTTIGQTKIGENPVSSFAKSDSNSNSATCGGGIYLDSSTQGYLNYTSVSKIDESGTVNITYNYVETTYDNEGGGGIFAHTNSKLYIAPGTTINYNATNMNGGGIYGKESTTYMSGGTIYCNYALRGGGICLSGEDYSGYKYYGTLYMYDEAIIGTSENPNSAVYGGGIYLADDLSIAYLGDGENKLLSGGISYNKAFAPGYGGLGGGIYNKGLLQVSSGSISNNISESDGGGVYNKGSFQFFSGKIESNEAGNNGGGVYNPSGMTFTMTGGTIESNSAVNGGGVYNKGSFNVSSGNIKSNTVTANGGGIYAASAITTENSEITKNKAVNGGGIYMYEDDLYIKKATTFNENTATNSGGAVYAYYTTIYIEEQSESAYAYIEPDSNCNDIYLDDVSKIISNATLSNTYYFARITPNSYNKTTQYIGDENDASQTVPVSSYYSKFLVTTQTVTDSTTNMATQVLWETTSEGKITTDNTTFVKIPAAKITGPVTDSESNVVSGVFIEGRTLELPSYYICDHEVTQGEYEKYCTYGEAPADWNSWEDSNAKVIKGDNYPACFVSWYDALIYCNLRSIAEGLEPVYYFESTPPSTHPKDWDGVSSELKDGIDKYYGPSSKKTQDFWPGIKHDFSKSGWRLPLEAEWEYAARAAYGTDGKLYMQNLPYSGSETLDEVAWMGNNAKIGTYYYLQTVKGKSPNKLGLYDMSGNVVEVCWDWFASSLTSDTGLEGPESGSRVAAPGGAYQYPLTLQSSDRISNNKYDRFNNAGFRIVRTIKE